MKVLPTQTGEAVTTRLADTQTDAKTGAASFKAVLASTSTDETAKPGTDVKLHTGETIQHVEGHAYAEVTAGKREGMYINTSGNVRNGEAFVLVRKHGKEYHIYGTGKDRLVVGFHMPTATPETGSNGTTTTDKPAADLSDIKLRKGEKIEPVEGHGYAEIVSGPRSGMYINTSQNLRRGEAFVLVEKADFDYHIYGTGADRQVVRASKPDDDE
jgi:hypothetical protein